VASVPSDNFTAAVVGTDVHVVSGSVTVRILTDEVENAQDCLSAINQSVTQSATGNGFDNGVVLLGASQLTGLTQVEVAFS